MGKVILNEKNIANYMKLNKCSREEAIDLINYDNAVEDDEVTEYDLTAEQKKNVQEMARHIEHAKKGKVTRTRKPNETKTTIIKEIADFLSEDAQNLPYEEVNITNQSRMITFVVNGKNYELTLIEKRAPKS